MTAAVETKVAPRGHRLLRWLSPLLIVLALVVFAALIAQSLGLFARHAEEVVRFPYPLNYGEGPLLEQSVRLAAGQEIYRPLDQFPYTISNYPPLFMLAQVPFVRADGPAYWYGRALSLGSALTAAVFIALTLFALTRDVAGALVGGVSLLLVPYILHWSPLNRIDSLALALSWVGLFIVVTFGRRGVGLILGALLIALAAYTRQTYLLAVPFAAVVWLWNRYGLYRAAVFALLLANFVLIPFCALLVVTNGGIFAHIVTANTNAIDVERIRFYASEVGSNLPLLFVGAGLLLLAGVRWRSKAWWLALPYLLGGIGAALTIAKVGSDVNYLYELSAALCFAAGTLIATTRRVPLLKAALIVAVGWQMGVFVQPLQQHYADIWLLRMTDDRKHEMEQLMDVVKSGKNVVADEAIGLLPLVGKPILFQPFEFSQIAHDGAWDQRPFLAALERGAFDIVLIYQPMAYPSLYQERWTQEMRNALNDRYGPLRRIGETTVLHPIG